MARKRKGKAVRLNKATLQQQESVEYDKIPHSFVLSRGSVGKSVQLLTQQTRDIMKPYTASNLRVSSRTVMKDVFSIAGPLGISHVVSYSATSDHVHLKLARFPRGPTLTFRLASYVLAKDVRNLFKSSRRQPASHDKLFSNHALLILNNFSTDNTVSLTDEGTRLTADDIDVTASTLRNMFPSIDVTRVKLNTIKRCLVVNFDVASQQFQMRHYAIRLAPVGLTRGIKKIVAGKLVNMAKFESIDDFVENGDKKLGQLDGNQASEASDSEFEDPSLPSNKIVLSQKWSTRGGNMRNEQSAIKLIELGPRLNMHLLKIEDGLHDGSVLYHRLVTKTPEEAATLLAKRQSKQSEKERRRREQAANIRAKSKSKASSVKRQDVRKVNHDETLIRQNESVAADFGFETSATPVTGGAGLKRKQTLTPNVEPKVRGKVVRMSKSRQDRGRAHKN